jgi:O-antigen ligase
MQQTDTSSKKAPYPILVALILLLLFTPIAGWLVFQVEWLLLAAGGIAGLLVGAAIFKNPRLGLYIMLAALPLEAAVRLESGATIVRLIGIFVSIAWGLNILLRQVGLPFPDPPILSGVILFNIWSFLSISWAIEPTGAFGAQGQTLRFIRLGIFVFMIVSLIKTPRHWRNMAIASVGGGIVAAFYGFIMAFRHGYKGFRLGVTTKGGVNWGDPNWVAWTLAMAIYFAILGARISSRSLSRLFVISIPFLVLGFLWTSSLSATIGIGLFVVFYGVLRLLRGKFKIRKKVILTTFTVLVVGLVALMLMKDHIPELTTVDRVRIKLSGDFLLFDLWRVGLRAFWERPLLGHGADQLRVRIGQMSSALYERFAKPPLSHNTFLDLAGDHGLIGLGVFLLCLLGPVLVIALRAMRSQDLVYSSIGAFVVALFFLFLGIGNSHSVLGRKELWFTIGLAEALRRTMRSSHLRVEE